MSLGAKFNLIGRLVADPKVNTNARGVQTAYLTVAVDQGYRDNQTGQWVDKADFHDVVAYGDAFVGMIGKNYHKGTLVAVDGSIGTRKVKLATGYDQSIPALRIENIMKLSFNQGANQGQAQDQGFNNHNFADQDQFADQYQNQGYGNLPPQ
jgi:single-strand DNA-binding protein